MKRVLLTAMLGAGKSTVRGYKAIDTDDGDWHAWLDVAGERDRVWREDRIQRLLSTEDAAVLFVSGTSSNQGTFSPQFDHVVLLSAPTPVLLERVATRTTNPYGKDPDELARILEDVRTIEPLLRRTASAEVATSAPVERVIETILSLVVPGAGVGEWRDARDGQDAPSN